MARAKPFSSVTAPPLASYDFIDILAGTGYITFHGGSCAGQAANYVLSSQAFPADDSTNASVAGLFTRSIALTGTDVKVIDVDFDAVINLPINLKGLLIAWAGMTCTASDASSKTFYPVIRLRKWAGTTETEIANATLIAVPSITTGTDFHVTRNVSMNIANTVHFKKGETLRLTVEVWGSKSGGTVTLELYHDPLGRADAPSAAWPNFIGQVAAQIPFKLNI